MKVALIITTYNNPAFLDKVLQSVKQQTKLPDEIIIADDGSTLSTKEIIDKHINSIPLQHCWQEDKGFRLAKIRNKAINMATADYIILIDGDMLLHRSFIQSHYDFAKIKSVIVGSRVLTNYDTKEKILTGKIKKLHYFSPGISNRKNTINNKYLSSIFTWRMRNLKRIIGCNLAFWREDAYKINGFNEEFIGWGREDAEFIARMMHINRSIYKLKFAAVAYHLYHSINPRNRLQTNDDILNNTLNLKLKYCDKGLSQYN